MPINGSEDKSKQRGEDFPIPRVADESPLTILAWPEIGYKFKGNCSRDTKESDSEKVDGEVHGKLIHDKDFPRPSTESAVQSSCSILRTENGSASMETDAVLRGGADEGDTEAVRMDFEKEDQADASF